MDMTIEGEATKAAGETKEARIKATYTQVEAMEASNKEMEATYALGVKAKAIGEAKKITSC